MILNKSWNYRKLSSTIMTVWTGLHDIYRLIVHTYAFDQTAGHGLKWTECHACSQKFSQKPVEYIQCLFSNVGFSVTYQNAETFQNAQARIICPLKNQIKFFNHLTFLNKYLMLCRRFNEPFSGILVRISKYWAFSLFETVPGGLIRSLQFLSVENRAIL